MRDYDELVKALRENAEWADGNVWEVPIILPDNLKQAADAIEELQKSVELEYQSGFADGQISANRKKNRWISVEERLPTPREKVVVAYSKGVTIAQMDGYIKDPKTRVHYWRGLKGPKHSLASVTHWMPLPEPPKEDEDGKD